MSNQKPISKSAFIKAEQCLKYFYLYKNHYYLRDPLSKEKQMVFKRGIDVGIYAQQLFPGGIDVTVGAKNTEAFAQQTKEAIEKGATVLYEATFIYDDLLVMVDILVKAGDAWYAYEVKSSLKISETYVKDACFQYYVLKNSLHGLDDFYLLTLNPQYVLNTPEADIQGLFKKRSVKKDAEKNLEYFKYKVQQAKETLDQQKIPDIRIGSHCFMPYSCEFIGTCWKNEEHPESIFNLGKISKHELFDFYNKGQKSILQLDADVIEKPSLKMQVKAVQQQQEYIDRASLQRFIERVRQPACSIDIEVWTPAIPVYQNTRPFEQIPFLYSLSYKDAAGNIATTNYIKDIREDSRELFLASLLDATRDFETVLVFDKTLEELVLNKCGELFPAYLDGIKALKSKIADLFEPIDKGYYYHPAMKGNFSLKSLAAVIEDSSAFDSLPIQSGIVAMYTYESLLNTSNAIEAESVKQQLIDYCNVDAETTLRLFEYYGEKVRGI